MGAAFRAREFRRSASLTWDCEGFETDNLARQPAGMRRAATLPLGSNKCMEQRRNHDAEICAHDLRHSPPSCPRTAVRRTASLRSPMSRASTPWRQRKAWMAGTSPAMTNDGFWRNEPERCSEWRFGKTNPRWCMPAEIWFNEPFGARDFSIVPCCSARSLHNRSVRRSQPDM